MSGLSLSDVDIAGVDDVPVTESCKLHGPPGTGKTTQSAARVARLLEDHGYRLSDVSWVTYRRSLAEDTLQRLVDWDVIDESHTETPLAEGATRHIGTFHAIGRRVYGDMGQPATGYHKYDFCDSHGIRYSSNKRFERGPGEKLFTVFSWLQNNLCDPSDPNDVVLCPHYEDIRQRWGPDAIGELYDEWASYRIREDLCDFSQMLTRPLEAGRVPPTDVVVIDEFHDATPLMAELAEMWVDAADIAIVAGDPHQVINGFDGASPSFFESFELPKVLLDHSYRVPAEHLSLAFSVLQRAHGHPPVTPDGGGQIREYVSPTFRFSPEPVPPEPHREASPAVLADRYGGSTMFLTRTRMYASAVSAALDRAGIPYTGMRGMHGWNEGSKRLGIYNALAALRPFDSISVGVSSRGGLSGYTSGSSSDAPSPDTTRIPGPAAWELLTTIPTRYLSVSRGDVRSECGKWRSAEATDPTVSELTEYVAEDFWPAFTAGAGSVDRVESDDLDTWDRTAISEAMHRIGDPIEATDIDCSVLTIHGSKGMEADDVVLYDGVTDRVRRSIRTRTDEAENEARTWYVATTRANKRLHIMRDGFPSASPYLPGDLAGVVNDYLPRIRG